MLLRYYRQNADLSQPGPPNRVWASLEFACADAKKMDNSMAVPFLKKRGPREKGRWPVRKGVCSPEPPPTQTFGVHVSNTKFRDQFRPVGVQDCENFLIAQNESSRLEVLHGGGSGEGRQACNI